MARQVKNEGHSTAVTPQVSAVFVHNAPPPYPGHGTGGNDNKRASMGPKRNAEAH